MDFAADEPKDRVVQKIKTSLEGQGFELIELNAEKPWGAYFSINEDQADKFISTYFPDLDRSTLLYPDRLRPKILLIAPGKRLSWQYHFRRAEVWRAVAGPFAIVSSPDDTEQARQVLQPGQTVFFDKAVRHRGVGLEGWGVVAEIWQHTEPDQPSDEADIVRVQDDFNR